MRAATTTVNKKDSPSITERNSSSEDLLNVIDLATDIQSITAKAEPEVKKIMEKRKIQRREAGKYLYAIVSGREAKSFGEIGVDGEEVYTIPFRDVACVVSDTGMDEYELTEQNARRHDAVLRKVMESHTVVPAEFGTVLKNTRILRNLLKRAYHPARECLKMVDDAVELGVKAVLKKGAPSPVEATESIFDEIHELLGKKAEQSVSGEIFSDRLILNHSFLVKKDRIDEFSDEVARLGERYPMTRFLYSGPWAPYNFVFIKIGKGGIEFKKRE